MHNVGFGDCFSLTDGKEYLLVDCGTKNAKRFKEMNLSFSNYDEFLFHILHDMCYENYTKKSALITHFHEDHYNGFKKLVSSHNNIFDEFYIPYIYIDDNNKSVFLELVIYFYTFFGRNSISHILSSNILNHISIVLNLVRNSNVYCLSTGKSLFLNNNKFHVIWPDRVDITCNCLRELVYKLNEVTSNLSGFNEIKDSILINMKEWYQLTSERELDVETASMIREVQEKMINRLDGIKGQVIEYFHKNHLSSLLNSCKYYYSNIFNKTNNATSIVFHNNDILMSGDVTRKIIQSYLRKRFNDIYYIIKVPHHGTNSHFSVQLPMACNLLISTGKRKGYGKIAYKYLNNPCTLGKRYCTSGNSWCNILDSSKHCIRGICHNDEIEINI